MIEAIVEYIRSLRIKGLDQNVFAFNLNTDNGAVVVSNGFRTTPDYPDFYRGSFQVVVRNSDIATAQSIAKEISDALNYHKRVNQGLVPDIGIEPYSVKYIYPRHLPITYPRSDGDLYEASVNFDICFIAFD